MKHFEPYANEADVLELGELTIENRLDRLELYGSLQITKDQAGLKLALTLQSLLNATVKALKQAPLPEHITILPPDQTDNPFQ